MDLPKFYPEEKIRQVLADVLPSLARAHARGRVHGHLRPEYLQPDLRTGRYRVLGWGETGVDPEYAAPEQLRGLTCPGSDLYSLGLICSQWLTGLTPFSLVSQDSFQLLLAGVEPTMARVLERLCHPDPQQRFAEADQVLIALGLPPPLPLWQVCQQLPIGARVSSLKFSPSGQTLAIGTENGSVVLWQRETNEEQEIFTTALPVRAIAWAQSTLAIAGDDQRVYLWDTNTREVRNILAGHSRGIRALDSAPSGQLLASGGSDKTVRLWCPETQACLQVLPHPLQVNCLRFSPQGTLLATGGSDCRVRLWDLQAPPRVRHVLEGHTMPVLAVAFHPQGEILATAGTDRTVRLWHPQSGRLLSTLGGHPWQVTCLEFSAEHLLSGSWDCTLKIWDPQQGRELEVLRGSEKPIQALAIGPQGLVVGGGWDQQVWFWRPIAEV